MQEFFGDNMPSVTSNRILYTPSSFARSSLLHLQEVGSLKAIRSHTSRREGLTSYLCFLVQDGSGYLEYEGKCYELKVGDVVFIDCRKAYSHSTGTDAKEENLWSLLWCHFYGPSMQSIYAKYCERGGKPVIHPADGRLYLSVFTDLYKIAASSDYIRDMRINEKLNILLTLLMEVSWHQGEGRKGMKKIEINQIKEYLDEHYTEKLTLESVAAHFFMDKSYLARLFKSQYGITLTTYLQQVRITHAKRLLRFTEKSVEEIGLECGAGELHYFSRVFKKLEGVSPSAYRRVWQSKSQYRANKNQ